MGKKLSIKQLRKQTTTLKRKVQSEKVVVSQEKERKRLRKELFRLKHRRGIAAGKSVLEGFRAGMGGAISVRRALRRGAIAVPIKKLKIKKRKKRRKKSKRRIKKIIVFR